MKNSNAKRRNSRKMPMVASVVGVAIVIVAGIATFSLWQSNRTSAITTFEDCKNAGGTISLTYPEQCNINGKSFVNDAQTVAPGDEEYVGLTERAALDKAKQAGKSSRVVQRDDESLPVTMDFSPGRLNLYVKDGHVYKVEVEGEQ